MKHTPVLIGIAILSAAFVLALLIIGISQNAKAKRAEVRHCVSLGKSPLECRFAVYGTGS